MSTILPPFGCTDPSVYEQGFSDAQNPLVIPPLPPFEPRAVDWQVYIATDGDDGWTGSPLKPVRSIQKAVQLAQQAMQTGTKSPGIYFKRGQKHQCQIAMPRAWTGQISAWDTGFDPEIHSNKDAPFWFGDSDGVQFVGLHFISDVVGIEAAIIGNGLKNLWIERCTASGFSFGFELTGSNNDGFKLYRSIVEDQQPNPSSLNHCSGVYIQGVPTWDIQGTAFYRCGLIPVDPNNPTEVSLMNMRHGLYCNESGGTQGGIFMQNLLIDCSGSAVGARRGGVFKYNVIRGGGDYNIIAGNEQQTGTASDIQYNALFGPVPGTPPQWGGGFSVIADTNLVANNWVAGSAAVTNNPWLTIKRGVVNVIGNKGWWTKSASPNNAIKIVTPGTPVPTLIPFPLNVGASVVPSILDWLNRSTR